MMPLKPDSSDVENPGALASAQLLHDIEAISKALFVHKSAHYSPMIPSSIDHKFAGKLLLPNQESVAKPGSDREDHRNKFGSLSSSWNWKKPLKALSHLRDRKFICSFFVHVHSIEGLPPNFNDYSLGVQFGRKNEVITTRRSWVVKGSANFDETLMHRCIVYGHRGGSDGSCNYEPKIFSIQVSVAGSLGLDIGRHRVDLTRLLPLTFGELVGERSSGKWTTSFKLAGKAKGAILNVSFGYLVTSHALLESSGNMTVSQLLDFAYRSDEKHSGTRVAWLNSTGPSSRSGSSIPSSFKEGTAPLSQLVDGNTHHEFLVPPDSELSHSIHILYEKLDEADLNSSIGTEASFKDLGRSKTTPESGLDFNIVESRISDGDDGDDDEIEFEIIDKGIEIVVPEKTEEKSAPQIDDIAFDISGNAIVREDGIRCNNVKNKTGSSHDYDVPPDEKINQEQGECPKDFSFEDLSAKFRELSSLESPGLASVLCVGEERNSPKYMETKSSYKTNTLAGPLDMDDVSESVANDFLDMLENEDLLPGWNSDSDPDSPRGRLLREFETEALISCNFWSNLDETGDNAETSSGAPVESCYGDESKDHSLTSFLEAAEEELDIKAHSLRQRRKAILMEDLDIEALMLESGFNEATSQNSPWYCSNSGFGSPIEVASVEEPVCRVDSLT